MKNELLKGLSEEQIEKLKECKNQEELLHFAKEEGIELNQEQLEMVSGGGCVFSSDKCPNCGSDDYSSFTTGCGKYCRCNQCNYCFQIH